MVTTVTLGRSAKYLLHAATQETNTVITLRSHLFYTDTKYTS